MSTEKKKNLVLINPPKSEKHKETSSGVWAFQIDTQENWAYWNEVFSPEECKKIIEIGNKRQLLEASVGGEDKKLIVDKKLRETKISWIYPSEETAFIFRRVTDVMMEINKQYFNFDLFGFAEGFQFTRYDSPDGMYVAHMDKILHATPRKLSLTIQLSSPSDYEGGELMVHTGSSQAMDKSLGKLIAFPSYVMHEVKPVTKGTRYSLVAWLTGPAFK